MPLVAGGIVALIAFLVAFWHITMVDTTSKDPGEASNRDDIDDANVFGDGNAATVRSVMQASSSVTDTAIFLSISLPHIQFISLSLLLPFGWPEFLAKIGSYISSLVSIDFGCACKSSSRCNGLLIDVISTQAGSLSRVRNCVECRQTAPRQVHADARRLWPHRPSVACAQTDRAPQGPPLHERPHCAVDHRSG